MNDFERDLSNETEERQLMIEDQSSCSLCGTELKFQHQVDYMTFTVQEEAHCPSCRIQMRKQHHTLQ